MLQNSGAPESGAHREAGKFGGAEREKSGPVNRWSISGPSSGSLSNDPGSIINSEARAGRVGDIFHPTAGFGFETLYNAPRRADTGGCIMRGSSK